MTPQERERLQQLLRAKKRWELLPGPQTEAADSDAFEILYGGEPGGGKSELITWLAKHRHYNALIIRRTFRELNRTLIPRALLRYGDVRFYNSTQYMWKWPGGQRVEFGYLDNEKDVYNYQGAEFDGFFPDELTQFPKEWYLYLFSRIRTTRAGQRTRVVATSNPGGEYEAWVKQRWAPWLDQRHPDYPAPSGQIRWYLPVAGGDEVEVVGPESVEREGGAGFLTPGGNFVSGTIAHDGDVIGPTSRTFIRAGLKDNPYLSHDKQYLRNLNLLPEPWRTQMMRGDWNAGTRDDEWQVIPTAWVLAAQARWTAHRPDVPLTQIGIDVSRGGKDATVFVPRYGAWFAEPIKWSGEETPDGMVIATRVAVLSETNGHVVTDKTILAIDVDGPGSSPVDILTQNGFAVVAMRGGAGSDAMAKANIPFRNKRAEWYWMLREALDPNSGEPALALPPGGEVLADLTAPRWKPVPSGIQVEPKDEIKKRLGRSPDVGDAIVYAHAQNFASGWDVVNFYRDMNAAEKED